MDLIKKLTIKISVPYFHITMVKRRTKKNNTN